MKKLKEFLCLTVPLAVIPILQLILILSTQFRGKSGNLKLLFNDPNFVRALLNTYFYPLIISFLTVGVFTLIRYIIRNRINITRGIYYAVSIVTGNLAAFVSYVYTKTIIWGLPQNFYNSANMIAKEPPSILETIKINDVLISLQIGFLIALLFWIAEFIICKLKNEG